MLAIVEMPGVRRKRTNLRPAEQRAEEDVKKMESWSGTVHIDLQRRRL